MNLKMHVKTVRNENQLSKLNVKRFDVDVKTGEIDVKTDEIDVKTDEIDVKTDEIDGKIGDKNGKTGENDFKLAKTDGRKWSDDDQITIASSDNEAFLLHYGVSLSF